MASPLETHCGIRVWARDPTWDCPLVPSTLVGCSFWLFRSQDWKITVGRNSREWRRFWAPGWVGLEGGVWGNVKWHLRGENEVYEAGVEAWCFAIRRQLDQVIGFLLLLRCSVSFGVIFSSWYEKYSSIFVAS